MKIRYWANCESKLQGLTVLALQSVATEATGTPKLARLCQHLDGWPVSAYTVWASPHWLMLQQATTLHRYLLIAFVVMLCCGPVLDPSLPSIVPHSFYPETYPSLVANYKPQLLGEFSGSTTGVFIGLHSTLAWVVWRPFVNRRSSLGDNSTSLLCDPSLCQCVVALILGNSIASHIL